MGPFTKIAYVPVDLNSSAQVKKVLLAEGWKPTTYNTTTDPVTRKKIRTSPKLTEDSYGSIVGTTGKMIARRNIIAHRRRTILNFKDPLNKGILSKIREADGRCPAEGITCATPTGRTTHRNAVCNVPKAKESIPYGIEMRSMFCVKEPYIMLGADLDGIEARITAHWAWQFDDGAYWRVLQECGDIHQYNADLISSDRDTAKSFQYAIFFGAQAPRLAEICKCSEAEAQAYIDKFWEGNYGVALLVESLEKFYKKNKYIVGLDGRKLKIRAAYKLLNTLIQGSAGIVFKRWGQIVNRKFEEEGIDCSQIIAYHDEFDYRCHPDCQERAIQIIEESAIEAGIYYGMKVPITTTVKVGRNWAQVH